MSHWQGSGIVMDKTDYDDFTKCIKGFTPEEKFLMAKIRMAKLRGEILPELQKIMSDMNLDKPLMTLSYDDKDDKRVDVHTFNYTLTFLNQYVRELVSLLGGNIVPNRYDNDDFVETIPLEDLE